MSDDTPIQDALERARRNEPAPCGECGTATSPGQLRDDPVPDRLVDFGGHTITVHQVRRTCPTRRGQTMPTMPTTAEPR